MSAVSPEPSALRKYIYEYSLIALSGCVVFLFLQLNDMNKFVRGHLMEQNASMIKTIEKNTDALNMLIDQHKK